MRFAVGIRWQKVDSGSPPEKEDGWPVTVPELAVVVDSVPVSRVCDEVYEPSGLKECSPRPICVIDGVLERGIVPACFLPSVLGSPLPFPVAGTGWSLEGGTPLYNSA